MSHKEPWFHTLLQVPYLCLIAGLILLLASAGDVKLPFLEYSSTSDSAFTGRLLLMGAALFLMLLGATLIMHKSGILQAKLGIAYFAVSLLLFSGIGVLGAKNSAAPAAPCPLRLFNNWNVSQDGFESQIDSEQLAEFKEQNNLYLLCRRNDPAREFEQDVKIQKSERFSIRDDMQLQTIAVNFDPEFSNSLGDGDLVECALVLLPRATHIDDIHVLEMVTSNSGRILDWASDDIAAAREDGPGAAL